MAAGMALHSLRRDVAALLAGNEPFAGMTVDERAEQLVALSISIPPLLPGMSDAGIHALADDASTPTHLLVEVRNELCRRAFLLAAPSAEERLRIEEDDDQQHR